MKQQLFLIEELIEKTEHYARSSAELYKLKSIRKSAEVVGSMASRLAVIMLLALAFLLINIGSAIWIGQSLGNTAFGFFILSFFNALLGIAIYIFRDKLIKIPVRDTIITHAIR